MKIIKTQEELDNLKEVKKDEEVTIDAELRLNHILNVYGRLSINKKLDCSRWNKRHVVAWGNSSVVAWGNSVLRLFNNINKAVLHGFSVCFMPFELKFKVQVKSKYAHIQRIKPLGFFERNGIKKTKDITLYKKVSKDFKTQEGTSNETLWKLGSIVTHKDYKPEESECGEGKFHACHKPYFCDEFRNVIGDRYIAIEINLKDLYEWKKNPEYPHKIGFRVGKVLYECDRWGKKV